MTISLNTGQFFSAPHKASRAWENLEALHTRCSLTPDSPALSLPGSSFLQDTGRLRPTSRPIFQLSSLSSQPGEMLPWSAPPQAISLRPSASCGPGRRVSICCRDPGQLASGPGTWHCPATIAHRVSFCVTYQELHPSRVPWGISGSLQGNRNTIRFCFLFLIRQTRCFYGHNRCCRLGVTLLPKGQ